MGPVFICYFNKIFIRLAFSLGFGLSFRFFTEINWISVGKFQAQREYRESTLLYRLITCLSLILTDTSRAERFKLRQA